MVITDAGHLLLKKFVNEAEVVVHAYARGSWCSVRLKEDE